MMIAKLLRQYADDYANVDLGEAADLLDAQKATITDREAEIKLLRTLLNEAATNPEGDYYIGLHCGVEDGNIYDRYDAADYGWEQAFEYVSSVLDAAQPEPNP